METVAKQNLRDAILKKKAHIVEIERALDRPLPTGRWGQPISVSRGSRLRLEEERQHLLIGVAELEREALHQESSGFQTQFIDKGEFGHMVTNAPKPISPVRGWTISRPNPTQIPPDCPNNYPNDLIPQTQMIIAEAVKEFSEQTRTLELCKHVTSKMTPLLRAAVKTGTMKAHAALSNSGMGGLLHSLLVYNCDNENERFRLDQEVRNSDEWLKFLGEMVGVQNERHGNEQTKRMTKGTTRDPEVAKRKALVISNRNANASEMCQIFDRERVPVTRKWQDSGFQSWSKAYKVSKYRTRIDVLVSKDRRN
jgi:hypothetical protein